MAKKDSNTLELVSEKRALNFCARLNDTQIRVVAMCIDGEIAAMGYPDGVRAGNPAFMAARLKAVTEITRRELDLEELAMQVLPPLEESLRSSDEATLTIAKATERRVNRYFDFLSEEAAEVIAANVAKGLEEEEENA